MSSSKILPRIAYLLILSIFLLVGTIFLSMHLSIRTLPQAKHGILDLRSLSMDSDPVIPLNGEWLYYPGRLDQNDDRPLSSSKGETFSVPNFWSSPSLPKENRFGYGVFRLRILLPDECKSFAIKLKNITPNYELWINDEFITGAGVVSPDRTESRPGNKTYLTTVPCPGSVANISVNISNYHNISAGINREILIGEFQALSRIHIRSIILEALTLGAIAVISLYTLSVFMLDSRKMDTLFLSILCFSSLLFAGLKNEMLLLHFFPFLEGEVRSKIIFLILNNMGGLIFFYFRSLYQNCFSSAGSRYFIFYMSLSSLIVLLFPMHIHSMLVLPMELFVAASIVIVLAIVILKTRREQIEQNILTQVVVMLVFISLIVGILDDISYIQFNSISLVFLLILLGIILLRAREYSLNIGQMEDLEDSRETLARINQELLAISQLDSLTGIANRRRFDQQLLALWQTEKYTGKSVGLIMIDIDYFKNYNDYYGHQKGDACLVRVVNGLKNALHRQNDFLARYGGEEFAVVLSDLDGDGVYRVAENLRRNVYNLGIQHEASSCAPIVTISVGCAVLQAGIESTLTELISQADKALYQAKALGRNQVCMDSEISEFAFPDELSFG